MTTSYFGNPSLESNSAAVSIARYPPRWWGKGRRYLALAPWGNLLKRYQAGLPWADYCSEFNAYLATLDARRVWDDLHDKILCCHEKRAENCHRHLVARWLEDAIGVEVKEL
jgi:uncharacterized protein (DUF488 family)